MVDEGECAVGGPRHFRQEIVRVDVVQLSLPNTDVE